MTKQKETHYVTNILTLKLLKNSDLIITINRIHRRKIRRNSLNTNSLIKIVVTYLQQGRKI